MMVGLTTPKRRPVISVVRKSHLTDAEDSRVG